MKAFMDKDFLLKNETARRLYAAAETMPIIDYHCHLNPQEIAENIQFRNIGHLMLGGDHYKWRQMRAFGIDEKIHLWGRERLRQVPRLRPHVARRHRQSALSLDALGAAPRVRH